MGRGKGKKIEDPRCDSSPRRLGIERRRAQFVEVEVVGVCPEAFSCLLSYVLDYLGMDGLFLALHAVSGSVLKCSSSLTLMRPHVPDGTPAALKRYESELSVEVQVVVVVAL